MAILKKAVVVTLAAGAGVVASAASASAYGDADPQFISPNLGCLANHAAPDLTASGLVGVVPVGVNLNHLLEHSNLNLVASGNTTNNSIDDACVANPDS